MKRIKVRCFKLQTTVDPKTADVVYATYPDMGMNFELMSCLKCGQIYALDTEDPEYDSWKKRILWKNCVTCDSQLSAALEAYPNQYRNPIGRILCYSKPTLPPDDLDAVTIDLPLI